MRRAARIVGAVVAGAAILALMVVGAFYLRFFSGVPEAEYPEPSGPVAARLQDLDRLALLPELDRSFSKDERAEFQQVLDSLRGRAETASDAAFRMGVVRAAAVSENGHTNVLLNALFESFNSLPVRFFWFAEGLYVTRTTGAARGLLGAQVLTYDGRPPEELLDRLDPYFGGAISFLRFRSPLYLGSPEAMHAIGLADRPDSVTLGLRLSNGDRREIILGADMGIRVLRVNEHPLPCPPGVPDQGEEPISAWSCLDPPQTELSFYGLHPERRLWRTGLPGGGVYLRLRAIASSPGTSLPEWLSGIRRELKADPASYLVLDLRSNYGGDYTRAMSFARSVDEMVDSDGRVYIMTDGGTFSAALVTAAFAVHATGDRGLLVGSRPGDEEQFWAEGGRVLRLPNSGLGVTISTGYHDWEHGCRSVTRCYWLNLLLDVPAGRLDPDIPAPLRFEDYRIGLDTGVLAILSHRGVGHPQ